MNESFTSPSTETTLTQATHEEISNRAQQIWMALGQPTGRDEEIWLQAERELRISPPSPVSQVPPATPPEPTVAAKTASKASAAPKKPAARSSKAAAR